MPEGESAVHTLVASPSDSPSTDVITDSPLITRSDVDNCSFASWFPLFSDYSLPAFILPLPPSFVSYLSADGLHLPRACHVAPLSSAKRPLPAGPGRWDNITTDSSESEFESSSEESVLSESLEDNPFPELLPKITRILEDCPDGVLPKLNWSAPKDAVWITATHSLKCTALSDILLLLKASDFVSHDISHAYDACSDTSPDSPKTPKDMHLVLRPWRESLLPSLEFRCFVRSRSLIAISQRDTSTYYPFLVDDPTTATRISSSIQAFLNDIPSFASDCYVVDLYITRLPSVSDLTATSTSSSPSSRILIVDFNPFSGTTDPLLFTWPHLLSLPHSLPSLADSTSTPVSASIQTTTQAARPPTPLLRFITSESEANQSLKFSANRFPLEVVEYGAGLGSRGLDPVVDTVLEGWGRMRLEEESGESKSESSSGIGSSGSESDVESEGEIKGERQGEIGSESDNSGSSSDDEINTHETNEVE